MRLLRLEDFVGGYKETVDYVRKNGKQSSPRGYKTWEVEDLCIEVADVRRLMPVGVGRGVKPEIAAAEALLLCGGLASPSLLTSVSGQFRRFLDGGVHHGAYGPRCRPQFEHVVDTLRKDPDSRQAIIQIYDPRVDQQAVRDVPCTLGFGFRVRDGELHMSSVMRSQDVWLGAAYDLFFFGQLGWTIANVLGIEFAGLSHHAYSLHLYDRNADAATGLCEPPYKHTFVGPRGFGWPDGYSCYEAGRERAEAIYNRERIAHRTWSETWYEDTLDEFDRLTASANFAS